MRSLPLLSLFCAGLALLAGCGGSQQPIGMLGATTQTHSGSWMLPEAKSEDLLYASNAQSVDVFSYPTGRHVGKLSVGYDVGGLCSDPEGDVFVDAGSITHGEILEYEHGGSNPIVTVKSQNGFPSQCAYDPTTGNLAVIGNYGSGPENIAIYENVTGKIRDYEDYGPFYDFFDCAYDASGNLFATGDTGVLGELPKGANAFVNYTPSLRTSESVLAGIQWDGKYVTAQELPPDTYHALLDRITIAHKKAEVVSRTHLAGSNIGFTWLTSGAAIGFERKNHERMGFWPYPAGGGATKVIGDQRVRFDAATISLAP